MNWLVRVGVGLMVAAGSVLPAFGLGEKQHVTTVMERGAFPVAGPGGVATLYVDGADWPGVLRAVGSFSGDVAQVTGRTPAITHDAITSEAKGQDLIVIGTIGRSALIDRLIAERKLDVSGIRGRWEMSVTEIVQHPFPGVRSALVIAGADKRGTIFGVYDLSEQIGVSPWAWWADVPVVHKDSLYVVPGTYVQPEPRVKYRGIFFNDEAPSLSGWTAEKFGGFNHKFYEKVFELLLRLKANFLWPAMWGSAFNEDDPLNPKLADEYGIVMSTSHHEPMLRAQQEWKRHGTGEWDYTTNAKVLDDFWRAGVRRNKDFESLTTIGMRGDGDKPMSPDADTALLEKIVADQRKILAEEVNPDVTKVPQVWALYKEVQDYYEKGMRVPDDVTLLWCDDNWGNIRRLPTAEERKRAGGAGIYYHFDYVGGPRSYKWLNTYSITKVWEQMNLAIEYGADRVWVVNVGDGKPMEFPIEFFLDFGRTPQRWGKDNLQEFTELWAAREFGPEHAKEIAELVSTYTKYNARRKPEQLEPTTFSLTQDHEADRVDADWRELTKRAEVLNAELPENQGAAFFELVLYPLKASAIVSEMYIAAGRNQLAARQGLAIANQYADETRALFAADAAMTDEYNHKLMNGKWDHMMDQTHIGYTFWSDPPVNAMPGVQQVQPLSGAHMAVFAEGASPFRQALPMFDAYNNQTRTIELANRGTEPFTYTATASVPWIHLSQTGGSVASKLTLDVTIDWAKAPEGSSNGVINIVQQNSGDTHTDRPAVVAVRAMKPAEGAASGFVENAGVVSIEAEHFSANRAAGGVSWQKIPGFGETLSGMEAFPVTAASVTNGAAACMDYSVYLFDSGAMNLQAVLAPTLNFVPGRGLRYSVAFDGQPAMMVDAWASNTQHDWETAVSDGVHKIDTAVAIDKPGAHTLHFCMVDPAVVLEKLVLSKGKQTPTYLGPPESAFLKARAAVNATGN
jgi:Glycosyl hydrolase family 115/Gylcosyl hydrolase family 115 C-terminal domain